jgi:predicted FMN-binding regulatory protein PaiB
MYTPSEFRVNDPSVLTDFLVQHPFGMLMLNGLDGIPVVTHLPFVVSGSDDDLVL